MPFIIFGFFVSNGNLSAKIYDSQFLSFKMGVAAPETGTPFSDFWKTGITVTPGLRIPYITLFNYLEFWIDFQYAYFKFDSSSEFPIEYYYDNPIENLQGNSISTYYMYLRIKISPRNIKGRFSLYLNYNQGIFHRSATVLRSDSQLFRYSKITFTNSRGYSAALGFEYKASKKLKLFTEIMNISAATEPVSTYIYEWSVGIAIK